MNQHEINEREWNDPGNWGRILGFYHSKADSRVWVSKPKPWMGWSLNMAKPLSRVLVLLFVLLICLLLASVALVFVH
jgi:uncharacterized membrane protein